MTESRLLQFEDLPRHPGGYDRWRHGVKAQILDEACLSLDLTIVNAYILEIDAVALVDSNVLDSNFPAALDRIDNALFFLSPERLERPILRQVLAAH